MPKTIDHDPREPNRKAVLLTGAITTVATLALAIPVVFGVRWVAGLLPAQIVAGFGVAALFFSVGFFTGQWDARRQRTPGND